MIRLVSCGIENARGKEPIKCARKDAELIYGSFQRHFPDFDNCYSIALCDVDAIRFEKILQDTVKGMKNTDILVVYFSGHAVDDDGTEINLVFYDGDEFPSSKLLDAARASGCSKLLILDCCHAGEAISLANYKFPGHRNFSVIAAVGPYGFAEFGESVSPFAQHLAECLDELDNTNREINLASIHETLEKNNYSNSRMADAVGEKKLLLKAAVSTAGNSEFLAAFWNKLPALPSSMRAIMWYALDSSNLGYAMKISAIERLNVRPHFYEGSWIVRRAIGHMLGELPQQEPRVRTVEERFLKSKNWMDICIGLVATRSNGTAEMQKTRREICGHPKLPMDVIWLANLYYADHFTESRKDEPGDEIFFPPRLCETAWGVEDLFARYKGHKAVLDHLEEAVDDRLREVLKTQRAMANPDTSSAANSLLDTYLKCPKRGRTKASYRDKWLRSVLFGQWRDHPMADGELDVYFQSTSLEDRCKDLKDLSSATVDIKLSILGYVSSLSPSKRKKYQDALAWALTDPHPWVRRDSFLIFSDDLERIKEGAFRDIVDRKQYPGVLDMIIEANAISKRPDWSKFIKEFCKKNQFSDAEAKAIESYLE